MTRTIQKDMAAIKPAAGIVSTQAHTIRPATPHLTADSRRVAPTPTMAPVIVCVVETGRAGERYVGKRDRSSGLGAKTANGSQLRVFLNPWCGRCANLRTACRAQSRRAQSAPPREESAEFPFIPVSQNPAGRQHRGDYAHRLLRVVATVTKRECCG